MTNTSAAVGRVALCVLAVILPARPILAQASGTVPRATQSTSDSSKDTLAPWLSVYSGVSFASADGFAGRQTSVPVTAQARPVHISLNARWWVTVDMFAEAAPLLKPRSFVVCDSVSTVATSVPTGTSSLCPAATATQIKTNPDSFRVVSYAVRAGTSQSDTAPVTGNTWQGLAVGRIDCLLNPVEKRVTLGAVLAGGFQTNPNVPAVRSLGVTWYGGLSLRWLAANSQGPDKISLLVLAGKAPVFPVEVATIKAAGSDTARRQVSVPLPYQNVGTLLVRLEAEPIPAWRLRLLVQSSTGYPASASVSVLKQINVGQVLEGIFGGGSSSGSTSGTGGTTGNASGTRPGVSTTGSGSPVKP